MNKTTSALIVIVLVIMVIVSIFGLYSGSLESVEEALMGEDKGSLFDNAQKPDGTTYESPDPTSNSFENNYRLEVV